MRLYRRNGIWHFSFTVAGKRRRESTRTPEKKLAQEIAAAAEHRHRHSHAAGLSAVTTFGEATALYLEARKSPRFLDPIVDRLRDVRVADLTGESLRRIATELYPNAAPATLNRQVLTPAAAVINHAADLGYCQKVTIKRFKVARPVRGAGDWPWIETFNQAAIGNGRRRLGAMALLMFTTGARIGQACKVLWADIDLAAKTVRLPAAKGHPARIAFLVPEALAAIAALSSPETRPGQKVFGYSGRNSVYPGWRATVKAAGLPPLNPHEAGRHGFGATMNRAGIDPVTASTAGGWSSPRVYIDTYAKAGNIAVAVHAAFKRPGKNGQ